MLLNAKTEYYDWNDDLVKACRDFVKFKDDMDMANRTSYIHPLLVRKIRRLAGYYEPSRNKKADGMLRRPATAINPYVFCCKTLPFLCTPNDVINEYNKRLIYPQLVVSGTYRTYDTDNLGDYSNNFPDKVMKVSDDFILDESENSGDLKYYRYDILLLYVASEGKKQGGIIQASQIVHDGLGNGITFNTSH